MSVYKNPYDLSPTFKGAVIRTWLAKYKSSDPEGGSDQFATCWSETDNEFVEVCYSGENSAYWDGDASEDATPEVLARWKALPENLRAIPISPVSRHFPGQVYRWRASLSVEGAPDRFAEALSYAGRLHRSQRRKGTKIPYLSHILSVSALVLEYGGSEDEAIAALLHDAMEDAGGQTVGNEIRRRFGDQVYAIVHGCSDAVVDDRTAKAPWIARKKKYIEHVALADTETKLVSAADKLHNARATLADLRVVGDELWKRFNAGRDDTLWYYSELVKAFRVTPFPERTQQLVNELARTVDELQATNPKQ